MGVNAFAGWGRDWKWWVLIALAIAAAALLADCTRVQVKYTLEQPQAHLVWPPTGEPARVRYLASIFSSDDLFVRERAWGIVSFLAGPAEERRFSSPRDVHMTDDGLLLVTDPGRVSVHYIDMAQSRYKALTAFGKTTPMGWPIGVTADNEGNIYVSDSALECIGVFNREGEFMRQLAGPDQLGRPADLAFDSRTGLLYVADVVDHEVKAFRRDGRLARRFGGRGPNLENLNFPTHLWIDRDGSICVTSEMDFAIKVFDASGQFLFAFGRVGDTPGYFSRPKGVAADSAEHIYVADAIFGNVQIFNRKGELLLVLGELGTGRGQFVLPAGVFIDKRDRIFVADQESHCVQVFEYIGGAAP